MSPKICQRKIHAPPPPQKKKKIPLLQLFSSVLDKGKIISDKFSIKCVVVPFRSSLRGYNIHFLARLDEVQEELLYYPSVGIGGGVSKKLNVKVFYVMGKALSGELSCPFDRSCYISMYASQI